MSKVEKVDKKRGRPKKLGATIQAAATAAKTAIKDVIGSLKRDAPEANYFILCNGKPVKNIKQLADIMDEIEDQVFNHHVRAEHNDFSAWVKDVFKDVELAEKLSVAKDKKHFQLVIYKHIAHKLW